MRCCTNKLDSLLRSILLTGLWLCASAAAAEGISISKAEARLTDGGYQLSANFDIQLSPTVEMALKRGVTLYFVSELTINRSRWYWLDTDVARDEQTAKLSYNALTQQYRITRGSLFQSFHELKDALLVLGHQIAPPVPLELLDKNGGGYFSRLLKKGSECCSAFAQMRLDVSQLPKPLQVNALTNEDWNLKSEPYRWIIKPEAGETVSQP
ncbi:MAG: DUF4390 domain-containing protein [Gammaproteobacteria bacterium]|nr:DUF4390 domain-containing protein [Gammaproteobacteria bacterium]MBU1482535.1 DUF4390 domain-containing protein [Gammaproteobacteria bacterium]